MKLYMKSIKKWHIGAVFLVAMFIFGCTGWRINGRWLEDRRFFNDTELDKRLLNEMQVYAGCFNYPPKHGFDESAAGRFVYHRIKIFHDLFPIGTPATTVFDELRTSGAECGYEYAGGRDFLRCVLTKQYIYGNEELYLFSWEIGHVYLVINEFDYLVSLSNARVISADVIIKKCETYEIDKDVYRNLNSIVPVKRLK